MQHSLNFRQGGDSDLPELADVMSRKPGNHTISTRSAYHYLINIDEFPEMLPLCYQIIASASDSSKDSCSIFPAELYEEKSTAAFADLPEYLVAFAKSFELDDLTESGTVQGKGEYLAGQLAPAMLAAGCWLRNLSRVATAHTTVAGKLNKLFNMQTMAYAAADAQHENRIGSDILNLFTICCESSLSEESILTENTEDFSFEFPLLLLSFAQFPREFLPELLGLNLAWHHLGIHAFVEKITLENFLGSRLPNEMLDELKQRDTTMTELSLEAIETFFNEQNSADQSGARRRILCGMEILAAAWMKWVQNAKSSLPTGDPDQRTEMIELIRSKGPHALGYHRDKKLGPHKIDDLLDIRKFDPSEVLDELFNSPFVVPGNAAKSPLTTRLVELGGPMVGIFSDEELTVIRNWINSLDRTKDISAGEVASHQSVAEKTNDIPSANTGEYPLWKKKDFLKESHGEYANRACSLRELYYKLANIEYFPDVLPVAEQFLIDRINRSLSTLTTGERPLPEVNYSYDVLEKWVFNKHRQQVESYQPFTGKPGISREAFIDATVALAPLLFIDGAWLQGITGVNTIQSLVGRKLFHVFFEELGMGTAELHHANIYRELLLSMGVELPDVTDLDFAFSDQFQDSAFEVPVLWLSISCFTRHYTPEILGLNLAVELAGLGGSNMEAHDTLKYFGFPTLFVDLHNSADNVSVGHAAWALDTIKTFMNSVAEREGPHNLDAYWHRIWSGMRLTLPVTSDFYWNPTPLSVSSPEQSISPGTSAIFRY